MSDNDLIQRGDAIAAINKSWTDDELILAIRALPAAQVTVKPLEWFEGDEPDEWKSGPYDVWCELGKYQVYYWSIVMGEPHETAKAAKAAAQADYDARIRSALTVTPHDPAKVQALVEAAQALLDLNDNYSPFGGEIYRDRVDQTWDEFRAALAAWKEG